MRFRTVISLLFVPVAASVAYSTQAKRVAALKPVRGTIGGRITTMAGKPLANVAVNIWGTADSGAQVRYELKTDANGIYRQKLRPGVYGVSTEYHRQYNGSDYRFYLAPNDGKTGAQYDPTPGVVKNFTWKISGLKAGERPGEAGTHTEPNKYYGNSAQISIRQNGFDTFLFPAGSSIEVIFTPVGSLIDGSTGKPQKRTFRYDGNTSSSGRYLYATDLPVGAYTAAATYVKPDGSREALGIKASLDFNGPFTPSVKVPFKPTSFGDLQQFQLTLDLPKS